MTDVVDIANDLQERFNASARPRTRFMPNLECKDCGERNDRPDYAICSSCVEDRAEALKQAS